MQEFLKILESFKTGNECKTRESVRGYRVVKAFLLHDRDRRSPKILLSIVAVRAHVFPPVLVVPARYELLE